jgi:hypothetical protein
MVGRLTAECLRRIAATGRPACIAALAWLPFALIGTTILAALAAAICPATVLVGNVARWALPEEYQLGERYGNQILLDPRQGTQY